jgi:hypothetical protein
MAASLSAFHAPAICRVASSGAPASRTSVPGARRRPPARDDGGVAPSRCRRRRASDGARELPHHRLYALLAATDPDSAHSRYNALVGRIVTFARAAEHARER